MIRLLSASVACRARGQLIILSRLEIIRLITP